MTSKKLTIAGVIILLSFMTVFGQSPSKFKLLLHSGVSFPSYPSRSFATFYNPALNFGAGISYQLSSKMSLILDFNHYRFVPKEKWCWYMSFDGGQTYIKLETPFYMGDFVYEFNDLILDLKIKPLQKRFSPYFIFGGGVSYRRNAITWAIKDEGRKVYFTDSVYYLVTTGLGLEYQLNKKIDMFLEVAYNYCFFTKKKYNTGVTPLRIGIAWGL
ncbi:MAG: hypothetical protein NT166_21815 [Candidatus Aminicenantes bacterium]|nr:hypothetical protein [Candidatus Aminicenantes bacterium]